jgi:glycerol-3-phosphate cytidylyltransferase-like family protein
VHTQLERAHNLTALRFVDKVLLLPPLDGFQGYNQLTQDVAPHIIAVTEGDLQMSNITAQAFNVKAKLLVVNSHIANFSSSIIYKLSQL